MHGNLCYAATRRIIVLIFCNIQRLCFIRLMQNFWPCGELMNGLWRDLLAMQQKMLRQYISRAESMWDVS
ncbi:hypothetical protein DOX54_05515 [Cronobacter sakazakii]|nr:hypothetical protein [Cronobacter sakazakii]